MDGSLFGFGGLHDNRIGRLSLRDTRLSAKLATTPEALLEVHKLRHESYLAYGHIDPLPSGTFKDKFDASPSSRSVVVYADGVPAASVRVSLYTPENDTTGSAETPATEIFKKEIDDLSKGFAGGRARATDINRLVRHPDYVTDNELVLALYRVAGYMILGFDSDLVLATVRPNHIRFYKRMGFMLIAEPRPFPRTNFQTALMACFRSSYEGVQRTVPFLRGISTDDATFTSLQAGHEVSLNPNPLPMSGIPASYTQTVTPQIG